VTTTGSSRRSSGSNGIDAALLADKEILRMSLPAICGDYTAIGTDVGDPGCRRTTDGFRMVVSPGSHVVLVEQRQAVTREVAAALDRSR
jgi:surfactin synthase thioesterase subunit